MNAALDQSHVRMIISSRLKFSTEEKGVLLRFCILLGQLGPNIYRLYPEDEVPDEYTPGQERRETGLYGPVGGAPRQVKLALPTHFQAPYTLDRPREGRTEKLLFQSLLQLAAFLLCHEVGHRDAPINDDGRRKQYEQFCDANALVLMRDFSDGAIPLPTRIK